jgi:hypothetical protein
LSLENCYSEAIAEESVFVFSGNPFPERIEQDRDLTSFVYELAEEIREIFPKKKRK